MELTHEEIYGRVFKDGLYEFKEGLYEWEIEETKYRCAIDKIKGTQVLRVYCETWNGERWMLSTIASIENLYETLKIYPEIIVTVTPKEKKSLRRRI